MRQGREIPARADGAALWNDWSDACVEHVQQEFHQLDARAGVPAREATGEKQRDRSCHRNIKWLTDAAGVAADQVALQRGKLVTWDGDAAEVAKPSSDAVD